MDRELRTDQKENQKNEKKKKKKNYRRYLSERHVVKLLSNSSKSFRIYMYFCFKVFTRNGFLLIRVCYLNLCVYAARPLALMVLTISCDGMNPVDAQYVLPLDPKSRLCIISIEMKQMKKEGKMHIHIYYIAPTESRNRRTIKRGGEAVHCSKINESKRNSTYNINKCRIKTVSQELIAEIRRNT